MGAITIIVPVKDEEVGLEYLLRNFDQTNLKELFEVNFIFVVDIRTSDRSKEFAHRLSSNIIDQEETTGKGAAVKQAIELWKNDPTQKVVFLDADGSYSFDSVMAILQALENDVDVVSGSRFVSDKSRPKGMSLLHSFGNRVLSITSSIRNRRRISDLCTGLWGFKKDALMKLDIKSNGFDLEAEIAGLIRRNKLIHSEVEVEWSQRKGGTSKLRSFSDGLIIFRRIIIT